MSDFDNVNNGRFGAQRHQDQFDNSGMDNSRMNETQNEDFGPTGRGYGGDTNISGQPHTSNMGTNFQSQSNNPTRGDGMTGDSNFSDPMGASINPGGGADFGRQAGGMQNDKAYLSQGGSVHDSTNAHTVGAGAFGGTGVGAGIVGGGQDDDGMMSSRVDQHNQRHQNTVDDNAMGDTHIGRHAGKGGFGTDEESSRNTSSGVAGGWEGAENERRRNDGLMDMNDDISGTNTANRSDTYGRETHGERGLGERGLGERGSAGDYDENANWDDDTTGNRTGQTKPSMGQKVKGTADVLVGKMTNNVQKENAGRELRSGRTVNQA